MKTDASKSSPLSPSFIYPRVEGSGLGAAVDRRLRRDGIVAAGEAEENGTFNADTVDVEDAQPQQTITTPELPPRAIVEEHRIEHWPPDHGAMSAMKAMDESDVMAV